MLAQRKHLTDKPEKKNLKKTSTLKLKVEIILFFVSFYHKKIQDVYNVMLHEMVAKTLQYLAKVFIAAK